MSKRVIAILNKDRDYSIIQKNFKVLFDKENSVLIYNQKYDTIPQALNTIIKKEKEINPDVEFIHIFHDDLIINEKFDLEKYEKFMDEYQLGYYFNPRLSPLNYVFEKVAPRLVIETTKYAEANVNVYAFDSREHIVINCKKNSELFNEDIKYLYNVEYIYRCQKTGIVPFLNFYFDNSLFNGDIVRDNKNFPRTPINQQAYSAEEHVLAEVHKVAWTPHSNADEVINYFRKCKNL